MVSLSNSTGTSRLSGVMLRLLTNDILQAAVVLFIFLLIFFSTPVLNIAAETYGPFDASQAAILLNTVPGHTVKNLLLTDIISDMLPWIRFNHESFQTGHIPLWNPYNANGIPHLANYQSAAFSPYTLPFYLLSFKTALILSAFLKLFSIGLFTFLYFKQIKLRQIPALVGATAFMFGGYNIVFLGWPLISVIVCLPACLFFTERFFASYAPNDSIQTANGKRRWRGSFWAFAGFSVSLAVGLLAGHPETFYGCFLLIAGYIGFRLINLWHREHYQLIALRSIVVMGAILALAGLAGAALSSVELLPFIEYVRSSDIEHNANAHVRVMNAGLLPLQMYPDLAGNPSSRSTPSIMENNFVTNYCEANSTYIGGFVCFLSVLSVLFLFLQAPKVRRYVIFFACTAILWLAYALNIGGIKALFSLIPGMSLMIYSRSSAIWLFSLSACAALFVNSLFELKFERQRFTWIIIPFSGFLFLAVFGYITYQIGAKIYPISLPSPWLPSAEVFGNTILQHIQVITLSFGAGLFAVSALWISRQHLIRMLLGGFIILVIFFQTGYLLKDFNPTVRDDLVYPVAPDIQTLQTLKPRNIFVLASYIWPDMNMVYKLPILSSYDVIGIRQYTHLLRAKFADIGLNQGLTKFDEAGLRLFGVDTVVLNVNTPLPTPEHFERVPTKSQYQLADYAIYKYTNNVPLYHVVYQARSAQSEEDAFKMVQEADFDPATTVVLNQPANGAAIENIMPSDATDSSANVDVISETPMNIQLRVRQDKPGYLVLAKVYYPGWKVKVNNEPQPLYRANYAFTALALNPGENLVEYYYDPDSFKIGVFLSLGTLILGGIIGVIILRLSIDITA